MWVLFLWSSDTGWLGSMCRSDPGWCVGSCWEKTSLHAALFLRTASELCFKKGHSPQHTSLGLVRMCREVEVRVRALEWEKRMSGASCCSCSALFSAELLWVWGHSQCSCSSRWFGVWLGKCTCSCYKCMHSCSHGTLGTEDAVHDVPVQL